MSLEIVEQRVRIIDAGARSAHDDAQWDAYASASPHAHVYHRSAWRRIIESAFGQQTYYLMAEGAEGSVCGVLPLARLRSRLFGDFMVSLPYVNYGGPCAVDAATERALIDESVRLAAAHGSQHLEIRTEPPAEFGLQVRTAKVSMRLPLPSSTDALWQRLGSKLRNQVKKAQSADLTFRTGGAELLDAFYDVFAENMRDLGTPVYGKVFFATMLSALPDAVTIAVVFHHHEPVGAGFLIGHRHTLEIPWASSLRRHSRLNPNMMLYWSVLVYACELGYTQFDFGRSSPDSGTYKFKEQWGAAPHPLHWQYWIPQGASLPQLNPTNPRYELAIRLWQRLPLAVTKAIGPSIVKHLP